MTMPDSWLRNDGMSIYEIAELLGVTPRRVQQLEARALEKIQQNPRLLRRLFEFVDFEPGIRPKEGAHR